MASTAVEVRDAIAAALNGLDAEVYTNTARQVVVPAVVVGAGPVWWRPERTFGPTEISREWNWALTVLVAHSDPESAFEQLAGLADAAVLAIDADATLSGEVDYAVVESVGPPVDEVVADSEMLVCTLDMTVRT